MSTSLPTGFSDAAETLERVWSDEAKRGDETVTFSRQPLCDQLIDVFQQCSQPGWDGAGSDAVERATLEIAWHFLRSLPTAYRTAAISGEPDGHINLEWYVHPRRILTVSINPNGILHWAALIGAEDPRGSCPFYGEAPRTLLYWIGRVCNA